MILSAIIIISLEILVKSVEDFKIIKINKEKENEYSISSTGNYAFYLDISSMQKNTEGVLTFLFSKILLDGKCIKKVNAKTINLNDNEAIVNFFPIKDEEAIFPLEGAYEQKNDKNLVNIKHLYFNNKRVNKESSYLLIYMEIELISKGNFEIILETPYFFTNATSTNIEKQSFNGLSLELMPLSFSPYFSTFYFQPGFKRNFIIRSEKMQLMTATCGDLLIETPEKKYEINQHRKIGYIVDIQQFLLENQCSKIIIKLLSSKRVNYRITLYQVYNPLKVLPLYLEKQNSYSIPIDFIRKNKFNLIGEFGYKDTHVHIYFNNFFGNIDIYYKKEPEYKDIDAENHLISDFIKADPSNILQLENNSLYLFRFLCNDRCYINADVFLLEDENKALSILYSGVYYMRLSNQRDFLIIIQRINQYYIEIEMLSNFSVVGRLDEEKFSLSSSNKYFHSFIDLTSEFTEEEFSTIELSSSSDSDCYLKVIVNACEEFFEIPLDEKKDYKIGSFENVLKSYRIIFPKDPEIESFQITVASQYKKKISNPISIYASFSYGKNGNYFIYPWSHNSIPNFLVPPSYKYTFELPNPYSKKLPKRFESDDVFYFVITFKDFNENSIASIVANSIRKQQFSYLPRNSFITVHPQINDTPNNFLLYKSDLYQEHTFLIIDFFKCEDGQIDFSLFKENGEEVAYHSVRTELRQRSKAKDHGNNYIIKIKSNKQKIALQYFYVNEEHLRNYKDYGNLNIDYKVDGNAADIYFKPYLKGINDITYYVYLNPIKKIKTRCDFINKGPEKVIQSNDTKGNDIQVHLDNLNSGEFWIDVVAKESSIYKIYKVYERKKISIRIWKSFTKNILVITGLFLLLCCGFLLNLFIKLLKEKPRKRTFLK